MSHPNVCDRNVALMGHCFVQKPLIAPYCLSDKSRAPDLAFKAFWDLVPIQLSGPSSPCVLRGSRFPPGPSQFPLTLAVTRKPHHLSLPILVLFFQFY